MLMPPRSDDPIYAEGPWSHRTVSANGTRFHVAERGDGPLVLLLHGFPEFWWAWRRQLISLSEAGYRAVAMDLRGYGGSDKPPRGYDLITAASDAAGLVRSLGEANAVIVGHDWGGLVAWTTAAYFPKVVRRLAVISVPHPLRVRSGRAGRPPGPGPAQRVRARFPAPVAARAAAPAAPRRTGRHAAAGLVRTRLARPGDRRDLPHGDGDAVRGPFRPGVPPLVCPVPVPARRPAVRPQHAGPHPGADAAPPGHAGHAAFCRRTARGSGRYVDGPYRWRLLDGAGHFPHEEMPERFDTELRAWLADPEPER